jgi:hypothetical protein
MAFVCRIKSLGAPKRSSRVLKASNGLLVKTPPKSHKIAVAGRGESLFSGLLESLDNAVSLPITKRMTLVQRWKD